ncbi:MAG: hypothetical protein ABI564_12975, partial [Ideonella sp.]
DGIGSGLECEQWRVGKPALLGTLMPTTNIRHASLVRLQRGLTLIDTLIGLALGLFVISNGLLLLASHLNENRLLVLEARLMQDLRTATGAITRDLRRAGYWGEAGAALNADSAPRINPYQTLSIAANVADGLRLRYSRDLSENHVVDGNEEFGFRLRNNAIDTLLGGSWQTLTDPATVRVTSLRLTPTISEVEQPALCAVACPPAASGASICPPRVQMRHVLVEISGESPADPSIRRTLQASARVRNDALVGACPS